MLINLVVCIIIAAALTFAQILLAKRYSLWVGFILPLITWVAVARPVYLALAPTPARHIPNYYLAGSLLFVGVWLLLIYFAFFYYWKCKEENKENGKNNGSKKI